MSDNLCQDGLGFVPKRIIRCLITMGRELEWFLQLPFKVQRQADGHLIACESVQQGVVNRQLRVNLRIEDIIYVHILRRHLELVFSERV